MILDARIEKMKEPVILSRPASQVGCRRAQAAPGAFPIEWGGDLRTPAAPPGRLCREYENEYLIQR